MSNNNVDTDTLTQNESFENQLLEDSELQSVTAGGSKKFAEFSFDQINEAAEKFAWAYKQYGDLTRMYMDVTPQGIPTRFIVSWEE